MKGWWMLGLAVAGCDGKSDGDGDTDGGQDGVRVEGRAQGDCTDGIDNDGDGSIDCQDDGCFRRPMCDTAIDRPTGPGYPDGYYSDGYGTGYYGTGTGGTVTYPRIEVVVASFDPPGCPRGETWRYRLMLQGWSARSVVNAFELGAEPSVRWNEEVALDSLWADPAAMTEGIGLDLTAGVALEDYVPGRNTLYRCGVHDGPEASSAYAVRVYDLDGNFSDCAIGLDPHAPPDAVASIREGTAWEGGTNLPPSGDWAEELSQCGEWQFVD